jgi:hypothetical protein
MSIVPRASGTNHLATVGDTVLLLKTPRGATPGVRSDPKHRQWQSMIQICQIRVKNNLVLFCIDIALLLVAFGCVGINHQKGEIEREMCPWAISKVFW